MAAFVEAQEEPEGEWHLASESLWKDVLEVEIGEVQSDADELHRPSDLFFKAFRGFLKPFFDDSSLISDEKSEDYRSSLGRIDEGRWAKRCLDSVRRLQQRGLGSRLG